MVSSSSRRHGIGDVHYATDGRDILLNSPDGWEVDRPELWWSGPADGDGTGGPWGNPPPGAELAAPSMYGLSFPAVTRCTQILCENIAGMPWKTYRGRDQLTPPAWITDPQAQRADGRRPTVEIATPRLSPVEFWAQAITSYLWWGEALIYTPRQRDAFGIPSGPIVAPLYLLHPAKVEYEIIYDSTTGTSVGRWFVDDDGELDGVAIDPRELIAVRNITRPGRVRGLGVIQAHAADFGFYGAVRQYADNIFQRGIPNGYLKSSKPDLDQAQADRLKRSWMTVHGHARKSIAVLNATTEFVPLELDPQTTQYLDLKKMQAWDVALMFGVPPYKLGISMGESNTYANLESQGTAFVNDSLIPIARKFEAAIDAVLPYGTTLKIDFRSLMRGDTQARYDAYAAGLAAGFLTVEEVRAWEDLPPLPGDTPAPGLEPASSSSSSSSSTSTPELAELPDDVGDVGDVGGDVVAQLRPA